MLRNCLIRCKHQCPILNNVVKLSRLNQRWNSTANINIFDRVAKQMQKDRAYKR